MENHNLTSVVPVKDPYYQKEFQLIHDSNETYKGKWNWWAFFFTGVWAAIKGCWGLAALIIFSTTILSIFIPKLDLFTIGESVSISLVFPHIIWGMIMGWRSTWFYYSNHVKDKF